MNTDLASIPFDQLAKLKQKLGVTGSAASRERLRAAAAANAAAAPAAAFVSKHRPKELPANKPVKTLRVVVEGLKRVRRSLAQSRPAALSRALTRPRSRTRSCGTCVQRGRDPRFDALSGSLNKDLFEKSYAFLDDVRKNETKALQAALAKEKDPERKEQLRQSLAKRVRSLFCDVGLAPPTRRPC